MRHCHIHIQKEPILNIKSSPSPHNKLTMTRQELEHALNRIPRRKLMPRVPRRHSQTPVRRLIQYNIQLFRRPLIIDRVFREPFSDAERVRIVGVNAVGERDLVDAAEIRGALEFGEEFHGADAAKGVGDEVDAVGGGFTEETLGKVGGKEKKVKEKR